MRKSFLLSIAAVSMFAIGCPSPEAVCESGVDQFCERMFECNSDQAKASDTFKGAYGTDVAACKTKYYEASKCAERKDDNDNCTGTNAGKTFSLSKASECSDAKGNLACADYLASLSDPSKLPAVCAEVCK
jgi:hypothetical protein